MPERVCYRACCGPLERGAQFQRRALPIVCVGLVSWAKVLKGLPVFMLAGRHACWWAQASFDLMCLHFERDCLHQLV